MKKHDQDFLTAIYQNALTACRSINNVISKVKAEQLKSELANQITLFSQITADCDNLANELGIKLKDLNLYEKSSMWFKINMATLFEWQHYLTKHVEISPQLPFWVTQWELWICYA